MTRGLLFPLLLALVLCGRAAAGAEPAVPAGLTAAEARHALDVLQDPQKRAQLIETLRTIAKAAPMPAETPADTAEPASPLAPDSLGAQLFAQLAGWPGRLAHEVADTARAVTDFPLLLVWARRVATDPGSRDAVASALWRLALVLGVTLLLAWSVQRGLIRAKAVVAAHAAAAEDGGAGVEPGRHPGAAGAWPLLRRLPFALALLALDLIPVGVFWGAGSLLAGLLPDLLTRAAVLVVVNAYATVRIVVAVGRMLVAPEDGRLRLLQIGDEPARFLIRWLHRVAGGAVFGAAAAELALLFGLYEGAYRALLRLVGLVVAALLAIMVVRCRGAVATWLRAPAEASGERARWRDWLGGAWHYLALIAIVAGWTLWAAGLRNGLEGVRLLLGTVAIVVVARLFAIVVLGMLDRMARLNADARGAAARAARYRATARAVVTVLVTSVAAVAVLQLWGAQALGWFMPGQLGARLASATATVTVAALAAIVVWEGANAALERRLARLSEAGPAAQSARLLTLLPILRAALLTAIVVVVGLTALSQIGLDIAPLLAGAGIIGVAIGFGSQKLVQDVTTGLFVLFENAIQVGDLVTVAGLTGNIERLTIRNLWLRGADGAVHIVPFSAVTSITNTNRGVGNAAISVTVAYGEDSDRVAEALKGIAAAMREEADFAPLMLGDLKLWVDSVRAWGVTFAGQIGCTDNGRWPVQREFNRRLQKRFQELGIQLSDWYGGQSWH